MEENIKLATELLHEIKASAKRWFVAFCVMVVLEVITITGFLCYISYSKEPTHSQQTIEDVDNNSNVSQTIGY